MNKKDMIAWLTIHKNNILDVGDRDYYTRDEVIKLCLLTELINELEKM